MRVCNNTRLVSSMIHSARPMVTPVASIVYCCFVFLDLKSGDGRTDGRTTCAKIVIPTGLDFGLAKWIKNSHPERPNYISTTGPKSTKNFNASEQRRFLM